MEISDEQILAAFRNPATKEEGFKMFVVKYRQRLYWQIRRMTLLHEDADDVLQNVFIKVWKHLGMFNEQSQLFTWLYRVAFNETLSFINQKKRRAGVAMENEVIEAVAQLKADKYFDGSEIQRKLQAAVATLPAKQREVFLLRYYDEMPYEEMSRLLGTSEGALKASYHHAVKKIEAILTAD